MPFVKGDPHINRKGRPKGSKNRRKSVQREAEEEAEQTGESPLMFLLRVMRDEDQEMSRRIDAARSAAPYIHRKQPTELETTSRFSLADALKEINARSMVLDAPERPLLTNSGEP